MADLRFTGLFMPASQGARNTVIANMLRCNSLPLGLSYPLLAKSKQRKSKMHDGERKQKKKPQLVLGQRLFPRQHKP